MQIAAEVRRFLEAFAKQPKAIKTDKFRLAFQTVQAVAPKRVSKEERTRLAKAVWGVRLGVAMKTKQRGNPRGTHSGSD